MTEKGVLIVITVVIILGMAVFCFAQNQVRVVAFYPTPFGICDILRARLYLDCDLYNKDVSGAGARFLKPSQESACETFIVADNIQTAMLRGTRSDDVRNRGVSTGPRFINLSNDLTRGTSTLDWLELENDLDVLGRIYLYGNGLNGIDLGGPDPDGPGPLPSSQPASRHVFDLAEGVTCADAASGDAVIADINNANAAVISTKAYDDRVMGVISDKPRVALGAVNGKKPVCLRGKVYANVTAFNGPVKRGDILVTSSKKGYCMAADLKKLRPGMIVGKALQTLEKGEGRILILVNVN